MKFGNNQMWLIHVLIARVKAIRVMMNLMKLRLIHQSWVLISRIVCPWHNRVYCIRKYYVNPGLSDLNPLRGDLNHLCKNKLLRVILRKGDMVVQVKMTRILKKKNWLQLVTLQIQEGKLLIIKIQKQWRS